MDLPPEILSAIIGFINHQPTLTNLTRCNSQLNAATNPHLYKSVTLREWHPLKRLSESERSKWRAAGLHVPWPGLINLVMFLHQRPDIAAHVRHLEVIREECRQAPREAYSPGIETIVDDDDLTWQSEIFGELSKTILRWARSHTDAGAWMAAMLGPNFDDAYLAVLLTCLPRLQTLDLGFRLEDTDKRGRHVLPSPNIWCSKVLEWNGPQTAENDSVLHFALLSKVSLRGEVEWYYHEAPDPVVKVFPSINKYSTVTDLTLEKVCFQDRSFRDNDLIAPPNLQRLALMDCLFDFDMTELRQFLDGCPPLRTLVLMPLRDDQDYSWDFGEEPIQLDSPCIVEAMQKHRASLVNLTIHLRGHDYFEETWATGGTPDLRDFTQLKRYHLEYYYMNGTLFWENQELRSFLPPGIEELCVLDFVAFPGGEQLGPEDFLKREMVGLPCWKTLVLGVTSSYSPAPDRCRHVCLHSTSFGLTIAMINMQSPGNPHLIVASTREMEEVWGDHVTM